VTPPCAVAVVVVVDEDEEDWRLGGMFLLLPRRVSRGWDDH